MAGPSESTPQRPRYALRNAKQNVLCVHTRNKTKKRTRTRKMDSLEPAAAPIEDGRCDGNERRPQRDGQRTRHAGGRQESELHKRLITHSAEGLDEARVDLQRVRAFAAVRHGPLSAER